MRDSRPMRPVLKWTTGNDPGWKRRRSAEHPGVQRRNSSNENSTRRKATSTRCRAGIDEFARPDRDRWGEIEMPIARLLQLASCRWVFTSSSLPSVLRSSSSRNHQPPNFPADRFRYPKIDLRTILDHWRCRAVDRCKDMLVSHHGELTRVQCAFVDTPEVEDIVDYVSKQQGYPRPFCCPE